MSAHPIDPEAGALAAPLPATLPAATPAAVPAVALDPDAEPANYLPRDHPAWMRDTLSVSQRARALVARMAPVVVKVASFWDHRVRSIAIGGRTLRVDSSGSYRVDA